MRADGTAIYCPVCGTFRQCRTQPSLPKEDRRRRCSYDEAYKEIAAYRRHRYCWRCSTSFVTAEIDEALIVELVHLRRARAKKHAAIVRRIRREQKWLRDNCFTVPLDLAEQFVAASAWWLTHSSGSPVRAPGHAERLRKSGVGWELAFGANNLLVSEAIAGCAGSLLSCLESAASGRLISRRNLRSCLKSCISNSVENGAGERYRGAYPSKDGRLVFGAQAIDLNDAVRFLIARCSMDDLMFCDLRSKGGRLIV